MKCYARWIEEGDLYFRDQTILQFGSNWNLLANIILLNPGSATPKGNEILNDMLLEKRLPYFVSPADNQNYYEFYLDRLMQDILKCFSEHYDGGVIKIYNLFNLKNQNSGKAIEEYYENQSNDLIHTKMEDVKYGTAPVVIATGDNGLKDGLIDELKKFIELSNKENIYSIQKTDEKKYSLVKDKKDENGLIYSYHPSYTFKYGNQTICSKL